MQARHRTGGTLTPARGAAGRTRHRIDRPARKDPEARSAGPIAEGRARSAPTTLRDTAGGSPPCRLARSAARSRAVRRASPPRGRAIALSSEAGLRQRGAVSRVPARGIGMADEPAFHHGDRGGVPPDGRRDGRPRPRARSAYGRVLRGARRSGEPGVPSMPDRGRHRGSMPGVEGASDELAELRRTVARIAAEHGLRPIAASCHPFSDWQDQTHTDKDRLPRARPRPAGRRRPDADLRNARPHRDRGRGPTRRPLQPGGLLPPPTCSPSRLPRRSGRERIPGSPPTG